MTQQSEGGLRATARVGGPYLFTGSITPHDRETGGVVLSLDQVSAEAKGAAVGRMQFDIPEEPVVAQMWAVYSRLGDLLGGHDLTLADIVRQRLFVSDVRDVPAVERVMDLFLGDNRPATSMVVTGPLGKNDSIRVQLDAIALSTPGRSEIQRITLPHLESRRHCYRYPAAVRVEDHIFFSNTFGIDYATDQMVDDPADLDGIDLTAYSDRFLTPLSWGIFSQTLTIFRHFESVLTSQGGGLSNLIKVWGWTGFPHRNYGAVVTAREHLLAGSQDAKPASTGLYVGGVSEPGAHLGFDAIASLSSTGEAKEIRTQPTGVGEFFSHLAVRSGPLVLTSGLVPIDENKRVVGRNEDLRGDGRQLAFGSVQAESGYRARAWEVYQSIQDNLAKYELKMSDVVHQTVYLADASQWDAIARVASLHYGAVTLPPTTLIPIHETSPFLGDCMLEIEAVAARAVPDATR